MISKEIANEANKLLELLHDSHDGYNESAQEVKDIYMKDLFSRLAALRTRMISEMELALEKLNIEPEVTGSMLAAGHRLFLDLKSLVTDGDAEAITNEIKRGENLTIERYKEALKFDMPAELKALIERQLSEIQANLNTVRATANV